MVSFKYRGMAFPMTKGPGGIPKVVEDADLVWNDVKLLFSTKRRSRVMRRSLGMLLEGMVFDNTGPLMHAKIYREVVTVLANFEPRASLESLTITDDKTQVIIDSVISIRGIKKSVTFAVDRETA